LRFSPSISNLQYQWYNQYSMTERLYLQDAYLATFTARIVERASLPGGRLAVVLDRTAFRPGGGGLPADRGWLNRAPVVELSVRERDGEILHVLAEEIWENEVQAQVDWPRRLDVMRQHTAGHLLADALAQVRGATVVGVLVGEQEAFLDLRRFDLAPAQIEEVEAAANEAIWSNRAIRAGSVNAAQAGKIGLSVSPNARWPLQVVSIEGASVMVCDGVHVARTGEVGLVKVLGQETQGDRLRLRFTCGARALAELRHADRTLAQIAGGLGIARSDVAPAVTRLASEWSATRADLAALRGTKADLEAETMAACAQPVGKARIVRRVYADGECKVAELRQLARRLVAQPGLVVLLGIAGEKAQLVFARSADVSYDMTVFVRAAAQMLNSQGGGQPALAESLPARADEARVQAAITKACKLLQAQR
jgi:alanyl-tRNA synthetase